MKTSFLFQAVCLLLSIQLVAQESASEIVKKADDKVRGKTSQSDFTIRIVRPAWSREMKMKAWSKGNKLAMILVTAPAKDKGTVFLKRDKEVWNWIPSIERSVKLPPSMMSQSWMGTDFTNDDLVKESSAVEDYTHTIKGDSMLLGRSCYIIEMIPKPEAAIVWGKLLTWIDKKDYMQLMVEFYDEEGELVNRMTATQVKMMGGRLLPSEMEMVPLNKNGHKTIMIQDNLVFDQPMDDSFFTTQQMKQIR
jgi:outer membrane lipoprotein-sorting protein